MRQPRSGSIHSTFTADSPTETKAKKVRRGSRQSAVSWSEQCLVRVIPSTSDLSEQELCEIYYRPEDYERIQEDVSETSFFIKHGTSEGDDVTFRGLESKKPGEARRRKLHRFMVCRAVIAGSEHQYKVAEVDDEVIGSICRSLTAPSTYEALERGAKDALDADQSPLPVVSCLSAEDDESEAAAARCSSLLSRAIVG
jgi:hypothetical protein